MERKRLFLAILIVAGVLIWLLVACGELSPLETGQPAGLSNVPQGAPTDLVATAAWDGYFRDAQATQTASAIEAEHIARDLRATDEAATLAASVVAVTIAAQQTADTYHLLQTRQAQAATTVAEVQQATETAVARTTATARAEIQLTESAAAGGTSTTVARVQAAETAAANATATSASVTATATAAVPTARVAARADELEEMELERERALQPFKLYGPALLWVIVTFLLLALSVWVIITVVRTWDARKRVIPTGPYGRPLIVMDGPAGRRVIVDPSRMFGPAAVVDPDVIDGDVVTAPALAPNAEVQERTTARSQAVELRQAAHPPYRPVITHGQAVQAVPQLPAPSREQGHGLTGVVVVNTLEEAAAQGILPPPLADAIESEWKVVEDGD